MSEQNQKRNKDVYAPPQPVSSNLNTNIGGIIPASSALICDTMIAADGSVHCSCEPDNLEA